MHHISPTPSTSASSRIGLGTWSTRRQSLATGLRRALTGTSSLASGPFLPLTHWPVGL